MARCPDGHESAEPDFCDVCGMRIQPAAGVAAPLTAELAAVQPGVVEPAVEPCPACGAGRTGQFCEACGFAFARAGALASAGGAAPARRGGPHPGTAAEAIAPAAPEAGVVPGAGAAQAVAVAWVAVVTADRDHYRAVVAADGPDSSVIQFPAYCPVRRFRLNGAEMRIGRRSTSQGLEPEIDLTGPPADPGISHLHAVLVPEAGGGWTILDPGSANGTQVNGSDIPTGVRVPLQLGDTVRIGGWTRLTIEADGAA